MKTTVKIDGSSGLTFNPENFPKNSWFRLKNWRGVYIVISEWRKNRKDQEVDVYSISDRENTFDTFVTDNNNQDYYPIQEISIVAKS